MDALRFVVISSSNTDDSRHMVQLSEDSDLVQRAETRLVAFIVVYRSHQCGTANKVISPSHGSVSLLEQGIPGDAPNEIPVVEQKMRSDYARPEAYDGVSEQCRIDQNTHSLFGASKGVADVITQKYGRYVGMLILCLCGGLIDPNL
jgi:hypothetical protein